MKSLKSLIIKLFGQESHSDSLKSLIFKLFGENLKNSLKKLKVWKSNFFDKKVWFSNFSNFLTKISKNSLKKLKVWKSNFFGKKVWKSNFLENFLKSLIFKLFGRKFELKKLKVWKSNFSNFSRKIASLRKVWKRLKKFEK